MELGTKYKTIEEVVSLLETNLGISFTKDDDGETGVSYDWSEEPNEFGASYYGIDILPTRTPHPETKKLELNARNWAKYTFVISVSDELSDYVARLRDLIARRVLAAEKIPEPR